MCIGCRIDPGPAARHGPAGRTGPPRRPFVSVAARLYVWRQPLIFGRSPRNRWNFAARHCEGGPFFGDGGNGMDGEEAMNSFHYLLAVWDDCEPVVWMPESMWKRRSFASRERFSYRLRLDKRWMPVEFVPWHAEKTGFGRLRNALDVIKRN